MVKFYSDRQRHLVCWPYSVSNLHRMAQELGIKRCWFDPKPYPHYDVPKSWAAHVAAVTEVVRPRDILAICKGLGPPSVP